MYENAQTPQFTVCNAHNYGKARCEPSWEWRPQQPCPDYDLWYVVDGRGTIQLNQETFPVTRGTCMLIQPGDTVYATQHPEHRLTVIYIHFSIETATPHASLLLEQRHQSLLDLHSFEMILNRVLDLADDETPYAQAEFDVWMKAALLHRYREGDLSLSSDRSYQNRQILRKVTALLRDTLPNPVTVPDVAAAVDLSPRYLSRLFKEQTGHSLKETITRIRLDRAKILLTETTMNITQIADAVGCSDIYHLSKQFKKVYGEPPSAYRHRNFVATKPHD